MKKALLLVAALALAVSAFGYTAVSTNYTPDDKTIYNRVEDEFERERAAIDAAFDAIEGGALDAGAIEAADLASDAVETAKIKDANVTAAKLATDSVETAKIVDDAVTTAKILDDNVTTAKILDDNVTQAKIDPTMLRATEGIPITIADAGDVPLWATNTHPACQILSGWAMLTEVPDATSDTIIVQIDDGTNNVTDALTFTEGTDVVGAVKEFTIDTDYDNLLKTATLDVVVSGISTTLGEVTVFISYVGE